MKVISLHEHRKEEKAIVKEAWRLLFDKILHYMDSDFDNLRFVLLVQEPTKDGILENCFSFNLTDDEITGFIERAKISLLLSSDGVN